MSVAIAIFVKTPSISPVKTRLAENIGRDKARRLYELCVKASGDSVGKVDSVPFWAVCEEDGLDDPLWKGFDTIYTGTGNLGDQQHNIYSRLIKEHEKVFLVGSDTPQISVQIIEEAIEALDGDNDFVIGPANDGGYYLFGGRCPIVRDVWCSVEYSTGSTCADFHAKLPSRAYMLPLLTDIDTEDDLLNIIGEMPDKITLCQADIVEWINENSL
jgi:glycosyltransferase A (GT-A) superfamily protein (DUF2064 family)